MSDMDDFEQPETYEDDLEEFERNQLAIDASLEDDDEEPLDED